MPHFPPIYFNEKICKNIIGLQKRFWLDAFNVRRLKSQKAPSFKFLIEKMDKALFLMQFT